MRLAAFAVAALCISSIAARADSITYTATVLASGSLNGSVFTNQLLTLTATSNTTTVTVTGSGGTFVTVPLNINGSVAGLGSFTIAGGEVFSNDTYTVAGFTDGSLGDILDIVNPAFGTYNLMTAIGPLSGSTESSEQNYPTTTGSFDLSSIGSTGSFQAVVNAPAPTPVAVTPEPSSIILLGTGIVGVVGMLRRRIVSL